MPIDTADTYFRTQVLTASPEQLRLLLIEGAVRFARQGREAITRKDYEQIFDGFSKSRNIVMELITSLRPDLDPELRARLSGLYTFIFNQLVEASFERDLAKADKAIELLEYERETWTLAMQKAASERQATVALSSPLSTPTRVPAPFPGAAVAASPTVQGAPGRVPLSVQG